MAKPKTIQEHRDQIAQLFIGCLKEKGLAWKKGWVDYGGPCNAVTKASYSGVNLLHLALLAMANGYTDPRWATWTQIVDREGRYHPGEQWKLKKGSKAAYVEYWFPWDATAHRALTWQEYRALPAEEREQVQFRARFYPVFHASMIDGIPAPAQEDREPQPLDALVSQLSEGMGVELVNDGGDRAFYRPGEDKIHLPDPKAFLDAYEYNATALHELVHATGHSSRLGRDMSARFGSPEYAYEELVAEIGSCLMGVALDTEQTPRHIENHKAYVQAWIQNITDKPETLTEAIRDAQKAADYMDAHTGPAREQAYETARRGVLEVPAARVSESEMSVDPSYPLALQRWYDEGRPGGEQFALGSTGPVLQGLGAMESDIFLDGDKVTGILEKHPEMSLNELKRIPEILEDPVLILKSPNQHRGQYESSRLLVFGTVKAQDGRPIMGVLDLRPIRNGFLLDDMQQVNSAYTKDSNPVAYISGCEVLHADKKRTISLLRGIGFTDPMSLLRDGSIGSISYRGQSVNISGAEFSGVVSTGEVEMPLEPDGMDAPRREPPEPVQTAGRQYPEEMVRSTLQTMVDHDLETSGEVSQGVLDVLSAQGYTLEDGTVRPQPETQPRGSGDEMITQETTKIKKRDFYRAGKEYTMTEERKKELLSLWSDETSDPETQEWRDELTPEEAAMVDEWDDKAEQGMARIARDTLVHEAGEQLLAGTQKERAEPANAVDHNAAEHPEPEPEPGPPKAARSQRRREARPWSPVTRSGKLHYTDEQYQVAKEASALEYARQQGYHLVKQGGRYTLKEHDSMVFLPDGRWHWNSRGLSGRALQFLTEYEGKTLPEAVLTLNGIDYTRPELRTAPRQQNDTPRYAPTQEDLEAANTKAEFVLPPRAGKMTNTFSYLCKTRGLDYDLVRQLVREGRVYETVHPRPDGSVLHNAVFVGFDAQGDPRSASLRGCGQASKFKREQPGSDKTHPFEIPGRPGSDRLYVFESAIDAASHATLQKLAGMDWESCVRIGSGGNAPVEAVLNTLEAHPEVREICFCLDNDDGGQKIFARLKDDLVEHGIAAERISRQIVPVGKDWNEYLQVWRETVEAHEALPTSELADPGSGECCGRIHFLAEDRSIARTVEYTDRRHFENAAAYQMRRLCPCVVESPAQLAELQRAAERRAARQQKDQERSREEVARDRIRADGEPDLDKEVSKEHRGAREDARSDPAQRESMAEQLAAAAKEAQQRNQERQVLAEQRSHERGIP